MALAKNYVSKERVVKSIIAEIVLDLRLRSIKKNFHLSRADQYVKITYHQVDRWYRENEKEDKEIIQLSLLIDRTLVG